ATVSNVVAQETAAKPQAADKAEPVKKDDKDQSTTDDSQQSFDIEFSGDDKPQPQSSQAKHDQSPATDASQLTFDASPIARPSSDGTNSQVNAATPLVAPITNALPAADQAGNAHSNNASSATGITSAQQRPRLPAQALAP